MHLEHTALAHLDAGSLFFPTTVQLVDSSATATLQPQVGVTNDAAAGGTALGVTVTVQLLDASGVAVNGAQTSAEASAKPGGATTLAKPPSLVLRPLRLPPRMWPACS